MSSLTIRAGGQRVTVKRSTGRRPHDGPTGGGSPRAGRRAAVPCVVEALEPRICFAAGTAAFDPTFGDDGRSVVDSTGRYDTAATLAVQADGKILLGGHQGGGGPESGVLVRLDADGSLDASFGAAGVVVLPDVTWVQSLAVQPDGRIVVAGDREYNPSSVVLRLNADGTPDAAFGTGGVVHMGGVASVRFRTLTIAPDGRIVAVGSGSGGPGAGGVGDAAGMAVVRLNADGSPDATFGGDGVVFTDFGHGPTGGRDAAETVILLPDGRILAGGSTADTAEWNAPVEVTQTLRDGGFALARYNPDGSLDTTFGGGDHGGRVVTRFPDQDDYEYNTRGAGNVHALSLRPDGGIVAAGTSTAGDFVVARYTEGGAPDTAFADGGLFVLPGDTATYGHGLADLGGGRFAALGLGAGRLSAVVLDDAGRMGDLVTHVRPFDDAFHNPVYHVALRPDGRVVGAGTHYTAEFVYGNDAHMLAVRLDLGVSFASDPTARGPDITPAPSPEPEPTPAPAPADDDTIGGDDESDGDDDGEQPEPSGTDFLRAVWPGNRDAAGGSVFSHMSVGEQLFGAAEDDGQDVEVWE